MLCSVGGVLHSPSATHLPRRTWPQRVGVLCAPRSFAKASPVNANPVSLGTRSTFDGLWIAREHPPLPASRVNPGPIRRRLVGPGFLLFAVQHIPPNRGARS